MKTYTNRLRRGALALAALAVVVGAAAPALSDVGGKVEAAPLSSRSITMSNATPGATNVVYALTMTIPSAAQSVIVDFCQGSPIIGYATCVAPTGMDASGASVLGAAPAGTVWGSAGAGTTLAWTIGTGSASQLRATGGVATTPATKYTIYFDGIENQSSAGTFYARVYTYTNATYGTYASPGSVGNAVDSGGFALATSDVINITATVQEQLTFCTSAGTILTGCTGTSTPNLVLGEGTPPVLLFNAVSSDNAYTQITTNATSGAVVSMKNTSSTTCAGLSANGGTSCLIPANITAGALVPGTAAFGAQVVDDTDEALSEVGSMTVTGNWGTASYMSEATRDTFGDNIYTTGGNPAVDLNSMITFSATAAANTPAGIYTVSESLIATGTF